MGRSKLERFSDIERFKNVFEYTDYQDSSSEKPKGRWKQEVFKNEKPITLELACGKGEYTLFLSKQFPEINVVGVDIKGARIWKGARQALQEQRSNVHFLRIYIDHLDEYFGTDEVDDIWITFPDPYLKGSDRNKRLTSPKFLKIYQQFLRPGGSVRLKTDNNQLFSYTCRVLERNNCEVIKSVENIYQECPDDELLTHKTYFERKHLMKGRAISYLQFLLPESPL
ncbi:tRNA (guanosine(46)-N7)-methyltransferase TrmB [Aliifodinibius salicampi]|uniref:tRNA (guanine-N(7)-)-methyltransferase n=1 Tax=Fodinibius salicampi TaxID=1920655 RepID=A0ABT3PY02_9BACT|nr:tRNA (guanosine(46)-N7)-methyltransferase TrmB [Fodinibius salicampi]MCW9712747.1 tRNA (guanosine(46)-N7)-methyltransferase TrmB [Fodinibius salicampi]